MAKYQNGYPDGAVPLTSSSGNVANANAVATLTPPAGRTAYITGIKSTSAGATVAAIVNLTVAGVTGGTMTFPRVFSAGAVLQNADFDQDFAPGIPGAAAGTAIVVTLPAGGAGNTNAAITAIGYYL